jgi:hypothetical protein
MYTSSPASTAAPPQPAADADASKDWYCLHGCQTNHPSRQYLLQVRQWLDAHPKEVVVFWLSRHGDTSLDGTKQYPATTVAERRAFWSAIEQIFEGKLVDSSHGDLNQVTMAEHWSTGAQVVIYATDYEQFTGNSTKAINAQTQLVTLQAIKQIYDRTFFAEIACLLAIPPGQPTRRLVHLQHPERRFGRGRLFQLGNPGQRQSCEPFLPRLDGELWSVFFLSLFL